MTRPGTLVVVLGTATEVGKTWVGARTIEHLCAAGVSVAARKPVQSFDPDDPSPTDAEELASASGEAPSQVCPAHRSYPVALAPPMATDVLGLEPPLIEDLVAELDWPSPAVTVGWAETVGGPRSPLAHEVDSVGFAAELQPDLVVLVADAGLGTINATRLSAEALDLDDLDQLVVVLNRFDPDDDLHVRNLQWLRREGFTVATDPKQLAVLVMERISLGRP